MSLKLTKNEESSRFEAHLDGELAGFADYKLRGDTVVFPHTEVDPKFGGKGIGSALIEFALNSVDSDGFKVAPICPFVAKAISKNPEKYFHLVPESQRAKYKLI